MQRRVGLFSLMLALVLALALTPVMAQDDALVIWADGERAPVLTELGADFEEEFGVPVEVQEMGLGDARDQLLVAGPVGEGPDIMIIPHDSIGLLVANGAIVPIDLTGLEEDFLPAALNLFTFNDELWGLPYALENIAFIRNTDLVPEAPATWDEVRAISEELQESGDAQYGFLVQTGNTYHNFPILSAFGGYIFGRNEDGTFNTADLGLTSEGGRAAYDWLSGMYNDGLMVPDVNDDVVFSLFESGDLAMFVTGPWFSERIVNTGQPYAISAMPGVEGVTENGAPFAGGQGFVISAFSENQLLAESFLLDFLATEEAMSALTAAGESGIYARFPVFEGIDTASDPNIEGFIAAGENSIPMPAIPEMGAVWSSSDNALTLISTGEDPVSAIDNAVAQIADAIELQQSESAVVGVPGSYQAAVGCAQDWDPACPETLMTDNGDGTFSLTVTIPAGEYFYKVALDGGWDTNYGLDGEAGGADIPLNLSEETEVTFTYDSETNIITDNASAE